MIGTLADPCCILQTAMVSGSRRLRLSMCLPWERGDQIVSCKYPKNKTGRFLSPIAIFMTCESRFFPEWRPFSQPFYHHFAEKNGDPWTCSGGKSSKTSPETRKIPEKRRFSGILEVTTRFELVNDGFADRCLTTWLRHHMK